MFKLQLQIARTLGPNRFTFPLYLHDLNLVTDLHHHTNHTLTAPKCSCCFYFLAFAYCCAPRRHFCADSSPAALRDSSASRCVKYLKPVVRCHSKQHIAVSNVPDCHSGGTSQSDVSQLSTAVPWQPVTVFRYDVSTGGLVLVFQQHLALWWRLCSSGLNSNTHPAFHYRDLCQAESPSRPLREAPSLALGSIVS